MSPRRSIVPAGLLMALVAFAATATYGAKSPNESGSTAAISMSDVVPFSENASGEIGLLAPRGIVVDRVEDECGLGRSLSQGIVEAARRKGVQVVPTAEIENAQGRILLVEIEGAHGQLGGALSGTKSLTVRGELRDGDTVIGSFVARRQQTALASGTCRSLAHCAEKIAKDIGKWLKNPTLKARLGTA